MDSTFTIEDLKTLVEQENDKNGQEGKEVDVAWFLAIQMAKSFECNTLKDQAWLYYNGLPSVKDDLEAYFGDWVEMITEFSKESNLTFEEAIQEDIQEYVGTKK